MSRNICNLFVFPHKKLLSAWRNLKKRIASAAVIINYLALITSESSSRDYCMLSKGCWHFACLPVERKSSSKTGLAVNNISFLI